MQFSLRVMSDACSSICLIMIGVMREKTYTRKILCFLNILIGYAFIKIIYCCAHLKTIVKSLSFGGHFSIVLIDGGHRYSSQGNPLYMPMRESLLPTLSQSGLYGGFCVFEA